MQHHFEAALVRLLHDGRHQFLDSEELGVVHRSGVRRAPGAVGEHDADSLRRQVVEGTLDVLLAIGGLEEGAGDTGPAGPIGPDEGAVLREGPDGVAWARGQ